MKLLITPSFSSKRSHKSAHSVPAAPPPVTRRKLPATAKATAAAKPVAKPATKPALAAAPKPKAQDLVWVLDCCLQTFHKPELLQSLNSQLLEQSRNLLGVQVYAVSSTPASIRALMRLFPGNGAEQSGSRAILGRQMRNPIVLLDFGECEEIANELRINVDWVAEALMLHETGHVAAWNVYSHVSEPDAGVLSEQWAWSYGSDLHRRFGRSNRSEFERVAAHCLKSHEE